MKPPALILASNSPRRQELLRLLGLPFVVRTEAVSEQQQLGEPPEALVCRLAQDKAAAVSLPDGAIIIAADTIVVLQGRVLGKPADNEEARRMLLALRGRPHLVHTGLTLRRRGKLYVEAVTAQVYMRPYSEAEINAYVTSGDPLDKAGAYGIQNRTFDPVERVEGCTMTVVGLPLCRLTQVLQHWGVPVPRPYTEVCRLFVGRFCPGRPVLIDLPQALW